jgi:hypothetical protein
MPTRLAKARATAKATMSVSNEVGAIAADDSEIRNMGLLSGSPMVPFV